MVTSGIFVKILTGSRHDRDNEINSMFAIILSLLCFPKTGVTIQTTTTTVLDMIDTVSVTGHRAFLPCDLTPPNPSEVVYLVLWYRGDAGEPLYSYDARHGSWNLGARWSDDSQFGSRAYFQLSSSPAELRIEDIKNSEAGVYRCRVDFKSAPTRNSLVNLTIIAPPRTLNIIDSGGQELNKMAGPYTVGSRVVLRCLSTGGNPLPEVTWFKDKRQIDISYEATFTRVIQNTLELGPLSRSDQGVTITCQSRNNNISNPLTKSLVINMIYPPVDVSITSVGEPLSADKEYTVECEAAGSRPDPVITWWLADTFIGSNAHTTQKVGNISKSVLTFTPEHHDDQKVLTCRAENTQIKDGALQDSWKLSVYYPPIVSLRLGLELGTDAIEEGKDVYFECKIKANPDIYKISWTHNGKRIEEKSSNEVSGLIMSGQSLVLQGVGRHQTGNYTCIVSNLEGDAQSNSVLLKILYSPRCVRNEKQTFGANIGSTLSVKCSVDAFPAPTSFSWGFNNSKDAVKINDHLYNINGSESILQYRTLSDHQFGHLYCWARNTMGVMRQPCIFNIIPATPPNSPVNCVVLNQTTDVLQVRCEPGFDGGLDQIFMLEVIDVMSSMVLANVSSPRPVFMITGLNPGRDLRLLVFATNKNGRSDPTVLEGFTTKVAQLQVETPVPIQFTPFLGILAGAVVTLLVLAVVVILLIRYKYSQGSDHHLTGQDTRDTGLDTCTRDKSRQTSSETPFVPVCRQNKPDIISPTSRGPGPGRVSSADTCHVSGSEADLAMISDTQQSLWIRDKNVGAGANSDKSLLTITMNPGESSASSWTPLLHNLSTESIL